MRCLTDLPRNRHPQPKMRQTIFAGVNDQPVIAGRTAALVDPAEVQRTAQVLGTGKSLRFGRHLSCQFSVFSFRIWDIAIWVWDLILRLCPRYIGPGILGVQPGKFFHELSARPIRGGRYYDFDLDVLIASGDSLSSQPKP